MRLSNTQQDVLMPARQCPFHDAGVVAPSNLDVQTFGDRQALPISRQGKARESVKSS